MKAERFSDPKLQTIYVAMLRLAADKSSELYHEGEPRRGAGHRAAFWDGFEGMTLKGPRRSPHVVPGTLSHAFFAAGQEFRKLQDAGTSAEVATGDVADNVLAVLDAQGKAIPLAAWIETLERLVSECRVRLVAAREDERRG